MVTRSIPLFGIDKNGSHVNNQWLICRKNVISLKRKNNMVAEKDIFFIDQELNSSSIILNLGDGYEVISGPRTTGDGYYESCIIAVEENQIEITV